jgi:tRNA (guanine10-N2)-methyltransferase
MKEYLAYFASKNYEFRIPELVAIAKCFGFEIRCDEPFVDGAFHSPFVKIWLPSDEAVVQLCSRAVSLFGVFEVWGEGATQEDVQRGVKTYVESHAEARKIVDERSFKFRVEGFNKHYPFPEQLRLIQSFAWLNWGGKAEMHEPQERFWVLELCRGTKKDEIPIYCYMARQISLASRSLVEHYRLQRRSYLGTTSMESEISFFTANQALAKNGSLVFDPFVGTGSLIVSCAALGAHVIGADIDIDVLLGKEKGKNVRSNFKQYNLEERLIDLIRFDNSKHSVLRTHRPFLDAIVCDPPYGIRAGAKKVGLRAHTIAKHERMGTEHVPIHSNANDPDWLTHTPQTIPYSVCDVLSDLLDFSARSLALGGRLVFWLPTTSDYVDADLPVHPCFQVIANSEQKLSMYFARRLITMEKIKSYQEGDVAIVPEQRIETEPAHANVAAKVTRQANRFDARNDTTDVPDAVTKSLERISGAELKRRRKAERRAGKIKAKAEAAAAAAGVASSSDPAPKEQ